LGISEVTWLGNFRFIVGIDFQIMRIMDADLNMPDGGDSLGYLPVWRIRIAYPKENFQ